MQSSSEEISSIEESSEEISSEMQSSSEEISSVEESTEEDSSSVENVERYNIRYVGIKTYRYEEMEIPSGMMKDGKLYPTEYIAGTPINIDDLAYYWTTLAEYEFRGYYQDPACEIPFTGITETTTGDVVIYALIQVYYNTPNI